MLALPHRRQLLTRSGPVYDPYLELLLAELGTRPPPDVRGYMNEFVIGLRTDDVWNDIDDLRVWWLDTLDNACYNWVNPTAFKASPVNSPTHVPYSGVQGDGLSSYVNLNWVPSNAVKGSLNNFGIAAYSLSAGQSAGAMFGTMTGASLLLQPRNTSDLYGHRVNHGAPSITTANADGSGFYAAERTGVNATQGYKEGSAAGSAGATTSTSLSAVTLAIGRVNGVFSSIRVGVTIVGAAPGPVKQLALRNRVRTFGQRVGAIA